MTNSAMACALKMPAAGLGSVLAAAIGMASESRMISKDCTTANPAMNVAMMNAYGLRVRRVVRSQR